MIRNWHLGALLRAVAVMAGVSAVGVACAYFFDVGISVDGGVGRFTWNFGFVLVLLPIDVILGAYVMHLSLFPSENGVLTIWNVEGDRSAARKARQIVS